MGWRPAQAIVDVDRGYKDSNDVLVHPETIFNIPELANWKVFLLGFSKYGSKDCWEPEIPLRGLPENKNEYLYHKLADDDNNFSEDLDEIFTYYTLRELKQIDLDQSVGLPEDPEKPSDYRYCLHLEMKVGDKWYEQFGDGYHTQLIFFKVETLKKAVESEKPIEININDEKFEGSYMKDLIKKTGGTTKLRAKPRKRKYYSANFPSLVELLTEMHQNQNFGLNKTHPNFEIKEDDIRLIFGQVR